MSSQPYASPAPTHAAGYDLATVFQPLVEKTGWIKFIGIWTIIMGVLNCLTIFGAIWGVPMIISGLNLSQSATLLQSAGSNDAGQLHEACQKMATSFFINGIILAISVVLMLLYFAFIVLVILGSIGGAMSR